VNGVTPLLVSTVDLSRAQFATTSLYHFIFVPLTLGLAPLVAVMQTKWYRSGDDVWLRLTHFFGTLLLINFAIGVATGLVQEFQFGMNWSVYSKFVGNVFGAPLAIEGLVAFFLEATFLGLWIFGWDRLPPGVHLATIWLTALGTWLSAYFILVANSFMQHPVGYKMSGGVAQLSSVEALLTSRFGYYAMGHTILAGLTAASVLMLGIACWHLGQGRNVEVFKRAAMLALVVAVPVSAVNLWFGSHFGIVTTSDQPMKIAAAEALWDTQQPASFSLFQIGGFSQSDPTPSFSIEVPKLLSYLSTGSLDGKVVGLNQLQRQERLNYGRGNYVPDVEAMYWSMRVMAYGGTWVLLVVVAGAWLYRRGRLETARWFRRVAVVTIAVPFVSGLAGWVLTEVGRQPWIVQGLLKTSDAASPSVGTWTVGLSLTVFVSLYVLLAVADVVLMRRYARIDPPPAHGTGGDQAPQPAMGY
jgi:cytochrome bd ubiquinol oxidase subunit I